MSSPAFLATLGALGLVVTACGGGGSSSLSSVPPVVSVGGSTSSTVASSVPTTPPSTTPTPPSTNDATDARPADTVPGERPLLPGLEPGLLPDDAFGDRWELQWRESDRQGFDPGPNQTTCASYWSIELLRTTGGAQAMWWTDGGNAVHYVGTLPRSIRSLDGLAVLADECATVKWLEGGSFDVTAIEVDDGFAFRFDDAAAGQLTWLVVTRSDDLVSVLEVPLWNGVDGAMPTFTEDDARRLLAEMHARLVRVATQPPSPPPPPSPAATTVAPPVLTPASTTVAEPAPSTTTPPPSGLAALLLTAEQLPPDFEPPTVREFSHGSRDEELERDCPAFESIHQIDQMFEWTLRSGNGVAEFEQIVGRASSGDEAASVVRRFGEVADCDLSGLVGGEVATSGGEIDQAGADVASVLRLEAEGMLVGELVLVAVGDVVTALTTEAESGVGIDDVDLGALVASAVDRIAAADG